MPIPDEINSNSYRLVGTIQKTVGTSRNASRANLCNRTFRAYLELYFQGKHDGKVRTLCASGGIETRKEDGTQVKYGRGETFDQFYLSRAQVACDRVAALITERWNSAPIGNHGTFVRGAKNIMAVQKEIQDDNHQYDLSFWYDGTDIFVSFHCYPPKK